MIRHNSPNDSAFIGLLPAKLKPDFTHKFGISLEMPKNGAEFSLGASAHYL
jgi:hypothetical protein